MVLSSLRTVWMRFPSALISVMYCTDGGSAMAMFSCSLPIDRFRRKSNLLRLESLIDETIIAPTASSRQDASGLFTVRLRSDFVMRNIDMISLRTKSWSNSFGVFLTMPGSARCFIYSFQRIGLLFDWQCAASCMVELTFRIYNQYQNLIF